MTRIDILNALARKIGAKTYLEIGVQNGTCIQQVQVPNKIGVDPDKSSPATFHCTSDHFFANEVGNRTFDLCFVDGLHHREQVYKDVMNSLRCLNNGGMIVVHDCDPPTEQSGGREMCGGVWCGDVWRGWMDLRHSLHGMAKMVVVDTDLGCGIIMPDYYGVEPALPHTQTDDATYAFFKAHRAEWLQLISVDEFSKMIANLRPIKNPDPEDDSILGGA